MNWKKLFSELPLLAPNQTPKDSEIIENHIDKVKYAVVHIYMPRLGACYDISLWSGDPQEQESLIRSISAELGDPARIDQMPSAKHYFWPSGSEEIPESLVYATLGKEGIRKILEKYGLGDEDERIIKDLLVFYEVLMPDIMARINYATWKVMPLDAEKRVAVMSAFLEINRVFAHIRTA